MNGLFGDKCAQCGKTRAKVASITQWIVLGDRCACDSLKAGESKARDIDLFQQRPTAHCPRCGGSVSKHDGSLTQWVFRSTSCKCKVETGTETAPTASATDISAELDSAENDEAIEVEAGRFPSERYTPLALIGSGQQGDVYKARDRLLNRLVCIKVLKTQELLPEVVIRFQREAQTGAKLTHPCLTTVLDFGLTGKGQPFLVMELCSGTALSDIVKEHGPLSVEDALDLFLQVCDGMEYAHNHGVLHRDLKTSNVLVSNIGAERPSAKIIDFGLAGLLDTADGVGQLTGERVMGTPAYMSPEQIQQKPLDERSDIYSIGCMMFETLTGEPIFEAESALAVLNMQVHSPPPTLAEVAPELDFPDALECVLEKTLAKDPEDRFQNISELKKALSDLSTPELDLTVAPIEEQPAIIVQVDPGKSNIRGALVAVVVAIVIGTIVIVSANTFKLDGESTPRPDRFDEHKLAHMVWLIASGDFHGPEKSKKLLKCEGSQYLKIIDPALSDDDLKYIAHIPLLLLDLSDTRVSDAGLNTIAKIDSLEGLVLNNNPGITDAGMKTLVPMKKLRVLALKNTSVTDKGIETLSQMTSLGSLDVSENKQISGASLISLAQLPALFGIRLAGTSIKPEDIALIPKIKSLKAVSLEGLDLGDAELRNFQDMKLITLDLTGNKRITGAGVMALNPRSFWVLNIRNCTGVTDEERNAIETERLKLPIQVASADFASIYGDSVPPGVDANLILTWYNPNMATEKFLNELEGILRPKKRKKTTTN